MTHPDQKYIDALLNNNYVVIEELYEKFSGRIKSMALKYNGTDTEAADIFQDTLMAIYNRAKQNDFILTGPLEPYLLTISRNLLITQLHKKKQTGVTTGALNDYSINDGFVPAEEILLKAQRRDFIAKKINELGEGCRQMLRLCLFSNSMQDVALRLQVTYGYARKKKSECLSKLLSLIKQTPEYRQLK